MTQPRFRAGSPHDRPGAADIDRIPDIIFMTENSITGDFHTGHCIAGHFIAGPDDADDGSGTGLATRTRTQTRKPSLYKVLLLNDDYTPMEFVVHVLQRFFRMGLEDATRVMLHVHQRGVGVCGIFTYEIAETKVNQVMDFARQHDHPLQCTMEKA